MNRYAVLEHRPGTFIVWDCIECRIASPVFLTRASAALSITEEPS